MLQNVGVLASVVASFAVVATAIGAGLLWIFRRGQASGRAQAEREAQRRAQEESMAERRAMKESARGGRERTGNVARAYSKAGDTASARSGATLGKVGGKTWPFPGAVRRAAVHYRRRERSAGGRRVALMDLQPPRIDFLLPHATWDSPPRRPASDTDYAKWLIEIFDLWAGGGMPVADPDLRFDPVHPAGRGELYRGPGPGRRRSRGHRDRRQLRAGGLAEGGVRSGAPETGMDVFRHSLDTVAAHPGIQARQQGPAGCARPAGNARSSPAVAGVSTPTATGAAMASPTRRSIARTCLS